MNNRLPNTKGCCREAENLTCGESICYDPLQAMPLAMAYVPWQQWQNVYEGSKGLEQGTIFEELIFPFQHASRVCKNGENCRSTERMERRSNERYECRGSERYERERSYPGQRMERREKVCPGQRMECRERTEQRGKMEQRGRMECRERRCD